MRFFCSCFFPFSMVSEWTGIQYFEKWTTIKILNATYNDNIKDGQKKKSHLFISSFLVRIVLFLQFIDRIYNQKYYIYTIICIGFIWIITSVVKCMFQSKKPKSLCGLCPREGATRIIVLYTCVTRETRKKGRFSRLNAIHANRI